VRNTRDPSASPPSGRGASYKPKAKSAAAQRESEGLVVPLMVATNNATGGKGPCFGRARSEGTWRSSSPGRGNTTHERPDANIRGLARPARRRRRRGARDEGASRRGLRGTAARGVAARARPSLCVRRDLHPRVARSRPSGGRAATPGGRSLVWAAHTGPRGWRGARRRLRAGMPVRPSGC
jgi:hypothetical protein